MMGMLFVGALFFCGGLWAAYWAGTQAAVARYRRLTGVDRETAKRYREAARIINDLEYSADLDGNLVVLPAKIQARVSKWNTDHRKAIGG
jgi:hypothetical protein